MKNAEGLLLDTGTPSDKSVYVYHQELAHYRATRLLDTIVCLQQAKELAELQNDTAQTIKSVSEKLSWFFARLTIVPFEY